MNTYKAVIDDIKQSHGRTMQPCWIADTKEKHGIKLCSKRTTPRKHPCPAKWSPVIESVLRKFEIID